MFVPLYDGKPLRHISWPFVNWLLIVLNITLFVWLRTSDLSVPAMFSLGLVPAVVNDLQSLPASAVWVPEDLTYITYAFLHGDFLHLASNMVFLWVFGDNVEDAMGHLKYFCFYLLCVVISGFGHSVLFATEAGPLIGASGAVAGVVAAYLLLYPRMWVWVLVLAKYPVPITAFWCLGAWVLFQIYSLFFDHDSAVSWIAHVSGIAVGVILLPFFKHSDVPLFERDVPR